MAGVTRLELAASGVTGRRSNQLSYTPPKKEPFLGPSLRDDGVLLPPPPSVKHEGTRKLYFTTNFF